jgi:hypothetical protein
MPEATWEALDKYIETLVGEDRSSFIHKLVEPRLRESGFLGEGKVDEHVAFLQEMIAAHGPDAVKRKLEELAETSAVAAVEGPAL